MSSASRVTKGQSVGGHSSRARLLNCSIASRRSVCARPPKPGVKGAERDPGDAPQAKAEAKPGHRWALLVGVNDYQNMPNLRYCTDDIEALRARLNCWRLRSRSRVSPC